MHKHTERDKKGKISRKKGTVTMAKVVAVAMIVAMAVIVAMAMTVAMTMTCIRF